MAQQHTDALLIGADPYFASRRGKIVALAAHQRMPAIYQWVEFATARGPAATEPTWWMPIEKLNLDWPHPQRREACRPAGRAADQVRAYDLNPVVGLHKRLSRDTVCPVPTCSLGYQACFLAFAPLLFEMLS